MVPAASTGRDCAAADARDRYRQYEEILKRSNLSAYPICTPTIDILPDLQVVRCFGMSSVYKVNLLDFRNTEELKRHFMMELDALAYHILPDKACGSCGEYRAGLCSCGCYAYRLPRLKELREKIHRLYGE